MSLWWVIGAMAGVILLSVITGAFGRGEIRLACISSVAMGALCSGYGNSDLNAYLYGGIGALVAFVTPFLVSIAFIRIRRRPSR